MMIFGRSLFGGATSGQILATGFAAVLATAVAVPEVTRLVSGNAQAKASVSVSATKRLIPQTSALATCRVTGAALCTFNGYVQAVGVSQSAAKATVEFFLEGHADALFNLSALASKRTRVNRALMWAFAYGEAEGQVYEYAQTVPARARAVAFGTTYHVGRTQGQAGASAQAKCVLIAGGLTQARVTAEASGECRRSGGAATNALAKAGYLVDAAVTREGVREFELVGPGVAGASAWISNTEVYQIQSVRSYAQAKVTSLQHQKGVKGKAVATSKARGIALGTQTGVTGVGGGKTTAQAWAEYRWALKAYGVSSAVACANASGLYTRSGKAFGYASLTIGSTMLEIVGQHAKATAQLNATPKHTHSAVGVCEVKVVATGFIQVNDIAKAPIDRTVVLIEEVRAVAVPDQPRLIQV